MPVLILLVIFGSVFATVFGISLLRHRQKMAELEVRKIEALAALKSRALPASSDDVSARATGARSTAAGVLVCLAGVAVLLLAKNGLGDATGAAALGGFVATAGAARLAATPRARVR